MANITRTVVCPAMSRIAAVAAAAFGLSRGTGRSRRLRRHRAQHHPLRPVRRRAGPRRGRRAGARCTTRSRRCSTRSRPPTCTTTFKSESFGVGAAGPGRRTETVPRKGVTIVRDRFNVPHITGKTRDDVDVGDGLGPRRGPRAAARAGPLPGAPRRDRRAEHRRVRPRHRPEDVHADRAGRPDRSSASGLRALRVGAASGGGRCCTTSTSTSRASTRGCRPSKSTQKPFTRVDIFAVNALVGPDLRPGRRRRGARARSSSTRCAKRLGDSAAQAAVRRPVRARRRRHADDAHAARSPTRRSRRDAARQRDARRRQSVQAATSAARPRAAPRATQHRWASNFLMVGAQALGHRPPAVRRRPADRLLLPRPDARGRHQGPGLRGARRDSPGFPGNDPDRPRAGLRLEPDLGRLGPDRPLRRDAVRRLAHRSTSTRASAARWARVDAGAIDGQGASSFRTTVHGPVIGYATVGGTHASRSRASARATASDILWQLPFRDATLGKVNSAEVVPSSRSRSSPFTFNVAYADDRDIAMFSAGQLPMRDPRVDPRLPDEGHGRVRVEGLPRRRRAPAPGEPAERACSSTGTTARRRTGARPTTTGPTAPSHRVQLLIDGLAKRAEARPRVGHLAR